MVIYTNAPRVYDYSYMEEISTEMIGVVLWRCLKVHDEFRYEFYQKPRYGSGLYQVIEDHAEYEEMGTW